jgi:hypothetical protein
MRRGDPERIYESQRRRRAEELVATWQAEAQRRGLHCHAAGYWYAAEAWFLEQG